MATATIDLAHQGEIADTLITTRLWKTAEPPELVSLEEAAFKEGVVHFDVVSGSDPSVIYDALRPVCGEELTRSMIEDLVQADTMPEIKPQADERIRAVSAFGVETSAGGLIFNLVEFLANRHWLITCSHRAESYARTGDRTVHTAPADPTALLLKVRQRWTGGHGRTAGDLGVLWIYELSCTYSRACRELTSRLSSWERDFYRDPGLDGQPLRDLHGLASEFLSRLNGIDATDGEAQEEWFSHVEATEIARRADEHINAAMAALDRLNDMLRGAFSMQQSGKSEQLQRKVELVTVVFLVPTLIAGMWGENTWVPGQNQPWGFGLTLVTMVVGALLARALMRHLGQRGRAS
jgi:hypothetical protein